MPIDFEGLANNNNEFGTQTSTGFNRWKPSPGENVIRLLPPTTRYFTEKLNYFTVVYNNHFVSFGKDHFEVFRCLRDDPNTPKCPACAFFFKYRNNPDVTVQNMAKEFNRSVRHLMNILVIETEDNEETPTGIQTYECGPGVYKDLKHYAANKRYGDIFDHENGRNMILTLIPKSESETRRNQYKVSPDLETSNVTHLLDENWKEVIDSLESKIPDFKDVNYINNIVSQGAELVDLKEVPVVSRAPVVQTPDAVNVGLDEDNVETGLDLSDLDDDGSDDLLIEDSDDLDF